MGGSLAGAGESPQRHFLQGMIVIAAAFHHCKRKESGGTLRLLEKGIGILNEYREAEMDLEGRDFLKEVTLFRDTYRASPCGPGQGFPRLKSRSLGRC